MLWVGQLLGAFGSFISPSQVRELALAPGTTMARLLVDPADGRCIERSRASYQFDAAMRAQLEAADLTCRAPGCLQPAATCQVDHVQEFGTPGGVTAESNGQRLDTGHHDPKTAKEWDASLTANRDVSWTSLLGRIYRTRVWDYRRYVTLLVDAIETVTSSPPQDQEDVLNQEVYRALTFRDLHDRLNEGDDDLEPNLARFEGWPLVALRHIDPATGRPTPGPSPAAVADAQARMATSAPADRGPARQAEAGSGESQPWAGSTAYHRGPDLGDWPDQTARCTEPGHDHPQWVGPYSYHELNPPFSHSRDEWARLIAERLADGTDAPPF